jgi:AmmeMemoRadiSam system protein A
MLEPLVEIQQAILLKIARDAIQKAANEQPLPKIDSKSLPSALVENGASFVTLTKNGRLRGCIGTLEAYQPLAVDVQEHAVAAALEDPRFPKVQSSELQEIRIEVSVLTPKVPLSYSSPEDLLQKLQPGIDGVVIQDGFRRATFLPQVWDQLPDPKQFLSHLCKKMGSPADLWQQKAINVSIYHVQEFHE